MATHDDDPPEDTQPGHVSSRMRLVDLADHAPAHEKLRFNEQVNQSKRLAALEVRLTQLSVEVQEALHRVTAQMNRVDREAVAAFKSLSQSLHDVVGEVKALRSDMAWKSEP